MIAKVTSNSSLIDITSIGNKIEDFNRLKLSIGYEFIHKETKSSFSIKHIDYLINRFYFQNKLNSNDFKFEESFKKIFINDLNQNKFNKSNNKSISKESFLNEVNKSFKRKLKDFQLENALKLLEHNCGATFSVPGAGKTTEILSLYCYYRELYDNIKLLVICPKNAVSAWTEEIKDCFNQDVKFNIDIKDKSQDNLDGNFALLSNGIENVKFILNQNPDLSIVTFQSNVNYEEIISNFISKNNVMCVIDESHRIKNLDGISTNSILNYSTLCSHKFIMSGTPMPQSEVDLKSQYGFLYPESLCSDNYYGLVKSIYVRTTKDDLKLTPPIFHHKEVEMIPKHKELYQKIKEWYKKNDFESLSDQMTMRKLKGCVMHLLQITSNPMIISDEEFQKTVKNIGLETSLDEYSSKFTEVLKKVRELTNQNEKVLIWTSFTKNIDLLKNELVDLNPVHIDGRVNLGDDESKEIGTRRGNIDKFKNDPNCMVFIANPAAASEGISLHVDDKGKKVCSKAIYLDRNFNCSQFLQSIDRIHRIGSKETPEIFLYKTLNSIDIKVQSRLDEKVSAMMELLNDKSLKPYISNESFFPNDFIDIESDEETSFYLDCLK